MSTPTQHVKEPIIETPVFTREGEQFGYVKEVQGGYFKIDVPLAKDYWLSTAYIAESTLDRVTLSLAKAEIEEHRLSAPGIEGQEHPEGVITDVDILTQRERMERELEEQREKMKAGLN